MYLGIEIGGTKLQLGIGDGLTPGFVAFERLDIDPSKGADGILTQIRQAGNRLLAEHSVAGIGVGFGGPIDAAAGVVTESHQIDGWKGIPLGRWCEEQFSVPTTLGNDCDCATLAEARYGAGRGVPTVFFLTVGTGVGGGFAINETVFGSHRPAIAEIGQMRPGLLADRPDATVESLASGWGIADTMRSRLQQEQSVHDRLMSRAAVEVTANDRRDLLERCSSDLSLLTTKMIGQAARDGNRLAIDVLRESCGALGWAIAQVITLLAPHVVVIGGGVSLLGTSLFLEPVCEAVDRYVFPVLRRSCEVVPAELGEDVVVHGAIALAVTSDRS